MDHKVAFITGGATGIGIQTALQLAAKGYHLVINYRNSALEAENLVDDLNRKYGTKNIAIQGDVANFEDCERMVCEAIAAFRKIDILIHNAGPYIQERKPLTDYRIEEWNYLLQGNLSSAFYLAKLVIPLMRKQKWGRIITMGFDRVETAPGWIYRSAFAAAKTGLASLTRTIAIEEAKNGITANMVSPGDIKSEWKEKTIAEAVSFKEANQGQGREGTGEDIARIISFLADEKSDLITGCIFSATGGMDVLGKIFREN
jgi:3-oxoacyl-[acyl-carrier protein] reductase